MEKLKTGDCETCDGNTATTYAAYTLSEAAIIYPITPSSPMGEIADSMNARGAKNVFGNDCTVTEMQSEAGAAGALHGSLSAGALTTTFTASQGLLLMIPNIYKLVGEMLPGVLHVAARAIAGEALSIFGDFSDIMAVRQTGISILGGSSVQECLDMAIIAHISALESSMPFIHFFDGFRLSHAVEKITWVSVEDIKKIVPNKKVEEFRSERQLTPSAPFQRGTSQGPELYFQSVEAANPVYPKIKPTVQDKMNVFAKLTGRQYHLIDYYGPANPDVVLITMGSAGTVCDEACSWLHKNRGLNAAVIKIRLFRPFPEKELVEAIPASTKCIAVLDRCKEPGALGEPLYVDVCGALFKNGMSKIKVVGGRYGLGSRDFTPAMVLAVIQNALSDAPRNNFTVGIEDDVTHLSLPVPTEIETIPEGTVQVQFWGLGQDGTVGSSKTAIKIIGSETPLFAQGYFAYDAKKAGGLTLSHLRFGPKPISSQYLIHHADYVSCNNETYVENFNILRAARKGATFVLNSTWSNDELTAKLPARLRHEIAEKELIMYNVDAAKVAANAGLPGRINMIMLTSFFYLSKVLDEDKAIALLKTYITKMFEKKGQDIVRANHKCVDHALENLSRVDYPAEDWLGAKGVPLARNYGDAAGDFVNSVIAKCAVFEGEDLPVSALNQGGIVPLGTSKFEKRGIALNVPEWKPEHCIQCNLCALVCPHAVIRPFMITKEEKNAIDPSLTTLVTQGKGLQDYNYRIEISVMDCTGCTVCVDACPGDADDKALVMMPFHTQEHHAPIWDKLFELPTRGHLLDRNTVKGSQAQLPLLEFSGACAGCGETPYVKLITQLFGERMVIANATGCTSIWGGSAPSCPYTVNDEGEGPPWANSLFEDGAEYGYGMALAEKKRRAVLVHDVQVLLQDESLVLPPRFREHLFTWLQVRDDAGQAEKYYKMIKAQLQILIKKMPDNMVLTRVYNSRHLFKKISQWIFGGDGWAYDIGFGGLDHVLASGENLNVLVLDTEVYSNTGGQTSKATPLTAVHKFAAKGKRTNKKDLGLMMMSYGNVFVAQCSLGFNFNQTFDAIVAAEAYNGPSLVICYAPCIEHGIIHDSPSGLGAMLQQEKLIVEAGMWPLFTYDPRRRDSGQNPMMIQSKPPKMEMFDKFIKTERRFTQLVRAAKDDAAVLTDTFRDFVVSKWEMYERLAIDMTAYKMGATGKKEGGMAILYGTETQNAAKVANALADMCDDHEIVGRAIDMEDYDVADLAKDKIITLVVSTYGQGEMPQSAMKFWEWLSDKERDEKLLDGVMFTVFALGDSSYDQFCLAAKDFRRRFLELGAKEFHTMGIGDDQDSGKYETGLETWLEGLWAPLIDAGGDLLKAKEGHAKPAAKLTVTVQDGLTPNDISSIKAPRDHQWVPMTAKRTLSGSGGPVGEHPSYEYTFDVTGSPELQNYTPGYALSVWPTLEEDGVVAFMKELDLNVDDVVRIESLVQTQVLPWPNQPIPLREIFCRYLDLHGRITKIFLNQLLKHAQSDEDKDRLKLLVSKEGSDTLKGYVDDAKTIMDMLIEFKSVRPPLAVLLSIIPHTKPRLYSIASSPNYHRGRIILAVVDHSWSTPSGKHCQGLCTGFLQRTAKLTSGRVAVALKAGTLALPANPLTPIIMTALGTGLAPFMSMIYERVYERDQAGVKVGAIALFFGCRYRAVDYIYGEELEALAENGTISLHVAFSRDQAHKVYIPHKMMEAHDVVHQLVAEQDALVCYCGSSGNAPNNVKKAFIDIEVKHGMDGAAAAAYVDGMTKNGRYLLESW